MNHKNTHAKISSILLLFFIAATSAQATKQTDMFNLHAECPDGSGEAAVGITTRIFADQDGQTVYEWAQDVPNHVALDAQTGEDRQVLFVAGDGGLARLTVNDKYPGEFFAGDFEHPFPTYLMFPPTKNSDSYHEETLQAGLNYVKVEFAGPQDTVVKDELVIVFSGVACSDALAATAPDLPDGNSGPTATAPEENFNENEQWLYQRHHPASVPEFTAKQGGLMAFIAAIFGGLYVTRK